MGQKSPSGHMGVGRGRFRQALLLVLLDRHSPKDPTLITRIISELGNECIYCGISADEERLQLDHLWPKSAGGLWVIGNLAPSCPTCNSGRRQDPWEGHLRTSQKGLQRRTAEDINAKVQSISEYMARHGQQDAPDWERILTQAERQLRRDFDMLLEALSDGALATAGLDKTKNILFDNPVDLFRELVELVRRHRSCQSTVGA